MTTVEEMTSLSDTTWLKEEWDNLLACSESCSPFQTWEWLATWWDYYGDEEKLLILLARGKGGELVGIAPLMLSRAGLPLLRKVEFIGTGLSDYLDFISLSGKKKEVCKAFFDYLESCSNQWDVLDFKEIPEYSPTADMLLGLAQQKGFTCKRDVRDICPYISLPQSWEAYVDVLSKNKKREIKGYNRFLEDIPGAEFGVVESLGSLETEMDNFIDLHQKRSASKGLPGSFVNRKEREFHQTVARRFLNQGWLKLFYLKVDGRTVASCYCFGIGKRWYYYLGGFDPAWGAQNVGNWAQRKVNTMLLAYVIQSAIGNGLEEVDLLRGDETYKQAWGGRLRGNSRVRVIRNSRLIKLKVTLSDINRSNWPTYVKSVPRKVAGAKCVKLVVFNKALTDLEECVSSAQLETRLARREDIEALIPVFQRGKEQEISNRFENGHLCFVAEQGGKIIHYTWVCFGGYYTEEIESQLSFGPDVPYIFDVFTLPQQRGKGIAGQVIEKACVYLRDQGYREVFTSVVAENAASLSIVRKVGFREVKVITLREAFGIKLHSQRDIEENKMTICKEEWGWRKS